LLTIAFAGATILIDGNVKLLDQIVETCLSSFSPNVDKVFVNKGTIIACNLRPYCRIQIIIKVPDAYKFLKKQTDYGNHHAVVYGDYVEELKKLGEVLGVRVESAADAKSNKSLSGVLHN